MQINALLPLLPIKQRRKDVGISLEVLTTSQSENLFSQRLSILNVVTLQLVAEGQNHLVCKVLKDKIDYITSKSCWGFK